MKILIVRTYPDILKIDNYNVQEIGLAKALIVKGNQCDIILYYGRNKDQVKEYFFEEQGRRYSYKIYWLHGYNFIKNGFMPSARRIIRQYDVIQVDEYDLIYSWMLYTRQIRPTVIYHGLYYSRYTKGYNLKCSVFDRMFLPLRRYDRVVALTKSEMASVFLRGKGFAHVRTVGVGIDAARFEGRNENGALSFPKTDKIRLLYVGKIEERRSSLFLLEVFRNLKSRGAAVELIVIGTGEKNYTKAFLKAAEDLIAEGDMKYYAEAAQGELAEVYKNCDIFLFPSHYEIFGMVLLEAMYFGLPVVSSQNGGSSVLIRDGENGRIVKDFQAKSWAAVIEELLQDREKLKLIKENAKKTVREGFLWSCLAGKFMEGYQEAIRLYENGKRDG